MKHADEATFQELADVLAALRRIPELTETRTGTFYRRSKAFVHFHDDPTGPYADLRTDMAGDFERVRVRTAADRRRFLARVRARSGPDAPPGEAGPRPSTVGDDAGRAPVTRTGQMQRWTRPAGA